MNEALLSVVPGAQFAFDLSLDRAEIFDVLAAQLAEFRAAGGGTVVDSTGMFHGRDLLLYEALSRFTGVHIVASTGMGPEELLGGYFLTPQTNPPTPWPAEKFADLFSKEISEGMAVPRIERRGHAALIMTCVTRAGATATDVSLLQGSARAARATGVPLSLRYGHDAIAELLVVLAEGLAADRVVVGGLDRQSGSASADDVAHQVTSQGAFVAVDSIGQNGPDHDRSRAALVSSLIAAGHGDRILLSSNSVGVAKGQPEGVVLLSHVLRHFVPLLRGEGLEESVIRQLLVDNPRNLLTVR